VIERIRSGRRITTRRTGSVAVELLLLAPIVLGLILGVVELSMMTAANEHLSAASREGCRVAALGGNANEIRRAVYNHLGRGNLAQARILTVFLEDNKGQPISSVLTLDDRDDRDDRDRRGRPVPCGEPVMVRVEIAANQAVPDLLAYIGFSISKTTLVGQTIMRKE
jgi:hypothetical protein